MSQIPLSLTTQLPYSSGNFINHGGVGQIRAECRKHLISKAFRLCFVHGKARTGKTHLSIQLAEDMLADGIIPRLLDGVEVLIDVGQLLGAGEVCIVDDAQRYLQTIQPGQSGKFVHTIEFLRQHSIPVVFLSAMSVEELPCDEHITSRLLAGAGLSIHDPEPVDMAPLIAALSRQRGLELRAAHIEFLEKRLARSIPALEHYIDRVVHLSRVLNRPLNFAVLGDACEREYDLKEISS